MSEILKTFAASALAVAEKQVEIAESALDTATKIRDELLGRTLVVCTSQVMTGKGCGAHLEIKDLTYIQTHWYTAPHGCTGGDYWNAGEGQFVCPKCDHRNRLYRNPEIQQLREHFAGVEKTYRQ